MIFVHVHAQYLVTLPRKEQSLDWREELSIVRKAHLEEGCRHRKPVGFRRKSGADG